MSECNCAEAFTKEDGVKIPNELWVHDCTYIYLRNKLITEAVKNVAELLRVRVTGVRDLPGFSKEFSREMDRLAREKGLIK